MFGDNYWNLALYDKELAYTYFKAGSYNHTAYAVQQACEKFLKDAVIQFEFCGHCKRLRKLHNLNTLYNLLVIKLHCEDTLNHDLLINITKMYTSVRYPGPDFEVISKEYAETLVTFMEGVQDFIQSLYKQHNKKEGILMSTFDDTLTEIEDDDDDDFNPCAGGCDECPYFSTDCLE